jgi:hypothetical protein
MVILLFYFSDIEGFDYIDTFNANVNSIGFIVGGRVANDMLFLMSRIKGKYLQIGILIVLFTQIAFFIIVLTHDISSLISSRRD